MYKNDWHEYISILRSVETYFTLQEDPNNTVARFREVWLELEQTGKVHRL